MNVVRCSVLVDASTCLNGAQEDCSSEIPQQVQQAFQVVISSVNFLCVEEFQSQYVARTYLPTAFIN